MTLSFPFTGKIAVIGLGYVGLPVAYSFAKGGYDVVGFDIDQSRIDQLRAGSDRTCELDDDELAKVSMGFSFDIADIKECDVYIITVPTPVDGDNNPNFNPLISASKTVGQALKKGAIVVFESTVYPGGTEEVCQPILENISGLKAPQDFVIGYSPERINPGDKEHRFHTIPKVVSAQSDEVADFLVALYGSVISALIHKAADIKTAECAKIIENTQRDINIALMNELAIICHKLNIDSTDVLEAAGTKWNFLPFRPGLVGGHCIGVDPYYLTAKAIALGIDPQVILSGRRTNDHMSLFIANNCLDYLKSHDVGLNNANVTFLGVTFKENVPDIRNSKVFDVISHLKSRGVNCHIHDPLAQADEVLAEYEMTMASSLEQIEAADVVVLSVPHKEYMQSGWGVVTERLKNHQGMVMDIKSCLDRAKKPDDITLWRL